MSVRDLDNEQMTLLLKAVVTGKEKQRYGCREGAWCGEPGLFDDDYNPYEFEGDDDDGR